MRENSGHGDKVWSEEGLVTGSIGSGHEMDGTQGSERIEKLVAPMAPTLAET